MFTNRRGITLITLIVWVLIIGAIVIYAPRIYNWYVEQNKIEMIKANVESVKNEIKSQLIGRHPVLIWNDMDKTIKTLSIQNPVTQKPQEKNGWSAPGSVVVYFDGVETFTIDGFDSHGQPLQLDVVISK